MTPEEWLNDGGSDASFSAYYDLWRAFLREKAAKDGRCGMFTWTAQPPATPAEPSKQETWRDRPPLL